MLKFVLIFFFYDLIHYKRIFTFVLNIILILKTTRELKFGAFSGNKT